MNNINLNTSADASLKKIMYEKFATDTDLIFTEEDIVSRNHVPSDDVWMKTNLIPYMTGTPTLGEDSNIANLRTGTNLFTYNAEGYSIVTKLANVCYNYKEGTDKTFIPQANLVPTCNNLISDSYGNGYFPKILLEKTPNNFISVSFNSGNFIFDYPTGTLRFIKEYPPSLTKESNLYVTVYKYTGPTLDNYNFAVGNKGEKGNNGSQGPQGFQGNTGSAGPQGFQGTQGTQGVSSKGDKGDPGTASAKGDVGPQGFQGTQGVQGPQGFQGARGTQGPQGIAGQKGEVGSTGPQGTQGIPGSAASKGDKGDNGSQGFQGNQGNVGPQGVQGNQGNVGPQGVQGSQGLGNKGDKGDLGTKGDQGNVGSQGPQGPCFPCDFTRPTTNSITVSSGSSSSHVIDFGDNLTSLVNLSITGIASEGVDNGTSITLSYNNGSPSVRGMSNGMNYIIIGNSIPEIYKITINDGGHPVIADLTMTANTSNQIIAVVRDHTSYLVRKL